MKGWLNPLIGLLYFTKIFSIFHHFPDVLLLIIPWIILILITQGKKPKKSLILDLFIPLGILLFSISGLYADRSQYLHVAGGPGTFELMNEYSDRASKFFFFGFCFFILGYSRYVHNLTKYRYHKLKVWHKGTIIGLVSWFFLIFVAIFGDMLGITDTPTSNEISKASLFVSPIIAGLISYYYSKNISKSILSVVLTVLLILMLLFLLFNSNTGSLSISEFLKVINDEFLR